MLPLLCQSLFLWYSAKCLKGAPKWKAKGKDDCSLKKGTVTPGDKQSKKSLPPNPSHGASKGLMTATSLITQGTHHLLMYKEYAIEMVESIIKEMDLDPCAEQETEDLGASGIFDLSRVCFFPKLFYSVVYSLADDCISFSGTSVYESTAR